MHFGTDSNDGNIILDVPSVLSIGFTIPIGPAIQMCEGGGAGGCNGDISTITMLLTTPLLWVILHIAFIPFVTTRPVRHRWFQCSRLLVENGGGAPTRF